MLATADGASPVIFGGSIFLDDIADSIQLVREHVHIELKDTAAHVSSRFWIYNHGETKNIHIGFPDRYANIPTIFRVTGNLTCKVNGQKITEMTRVSLTETSKENPRLLISSSIWIRWKMSIGKNDTVLIENEYDSNLRNYICQNSFLYTAGSGVTWDGPVVEGRFTFDHSDLFSTNVVIRDTTNRGQLRREYFDDSVVYSFSNYSPGREEIFGVKAFQVFWSLIDDIGSNPCPFRDVETIETAQKLRNEVYALHGSPFKDTVLLRYYKARRWYKPDPSFDFTRFSPGDIKFLQNLDRIETGLKTKK
jgi:hypothetical protein